MEFLINNPWAMFMLMCLCWPGLIPIILAFVIARRGLPFQARWTGWQQGQQQQGGNSDV